jgi:hypothetical protein
MENSLEKLIGYSGDSLLIDYVFRDGIAQLTLNMDELEVCMVISIPTDTIRAEDISDLVKNRRTEALTCYLHIIELSTLLKTQHGYYMAPTDFVSLMKDTRLGVSLAYGRKITEVSWLFRVIGSSLLFSCLVSDTKTISWTEIDSL